MLGLDGYWYATKDTDPRAQGLYMRHYSVKNHRGWWPMGFVPSGDDMVLLTLDCAALFVWKAHRAQEVKHVHSRGYDDGQRGINCMVFRNEGPVLSSALIREADSLAWQRWPDERLYTYVDAVKTAGRRSRNALAGKCFIEAGWEQCGVTTKGLVILEHMPPTNEAV
jgi:hypothetical protein